MHINEHSIQLSPGRWAAISYPTKVTQDELNTILLFVQLLAEGKIPTEDTEDTED